MEKKRKLKFNTMSSVLLQMVTVICGFIVPKLILNAYGSSVNGLVNSITQFLGIITLLDFGVGTVVQSSLYRPIVEQDLYKISCIYKSANSFFKKIAYIFCVYLAGLVFVYPQYINKEFSFAYTSVLIVAIGISLFAQYYFGIVNMLFLEADQKGYIQYNVQTITLILNTVSCVFLIKLGATIHVVKLITSLIFVIRPAFLYLYVKHNYKIDKTVVVKGEPIDQKWNGVAQHLASFVLTGTDNIVLTMFSTLASVSVYSVYNLIVNGVFTVVNSLTKGYFPFLGNLWAEKNELKLKKEFSNFEWMVHTTTVLLFGCTLSLIVDFVKVYTMGIKDTDYIQPIFAVLLVLAFVFRALRIPYNYLILAAGHYKQTQRCYWIAMFVNIVVSVMAVCNYGLIGVAIGTVLSLCYQTIWMALYTYKYLLKTPISIFVRYIIGDFFVILCGGLINLLIDIDCTDYTVWTFKALIVFTIWLIIVIIYNKCFYRDNYNNVCDKILKKYRK